MTKGVMKTLFLILLTTATLLSSPLPDKTPIWTFELAEGQWIALQYDRQQIYVWGQHEGLEFHQKPLLLKRQKGMSQDDLRQQAINLVELLDLSLDE